MNSSHCCGACRPTGRRVAGVAGSVLPGAALVLMPKCPMCVAAYVAAGTGLSLSLPAAAWLRTGSILLCVASISLVAATTIRRHFIRKEK
jgi:hypothetical protein